MKVGRNSLCPCGSGQKYKKCCLGKPLATTLVRGPGNTIVMVDERTSKIPSLIKGGLQTVLGVDVWIPRLEVQVSLRSAAERHLRQKYKPGEYQGRDQVNEILQYLFSYYDEVLRQELGTVVARDSLDFLLHLNEQWCEISTRKRFGNAWGSNAEREFVESRGGLIRRGLKHILELMCQAESSVETYSGSTDHLVWRMDKVLIAAEELVKLSYASSQTYRLFPDSTTVDILPSGQEPYMGLRIAPEDEEKVQSYHQRHAAWESAVDTTQRGTYASLLIDVVQGMPEVLDSAFKEDLGFSFTDIVQVLELLRSSVPPAQYSFTPFVLREDITKALAGYLQLPAEAVRDILDIFTITPASLASESPEIWKPKRRVRLLRRPLLQIPHPTGLHLAFGPQQLREAQQIFVDELQKRKLPPEWNGRRLMHVREALESIHKEANLRLEQVTLEELKRRGFAGSRGVKSRRLRTADGRRITMPPQVSEIDILCIDPKNKVLVVGECKNVFFASEPTGWFDDLREFVLDANSFKSKFLKKAEWVQEWAENIIDALATEAGVTVEGEWRIAPVLVTTHETFAAAFITEFSCTSLAVLLHEFDVSGQWPFERFARPLRKA